MGGHPPPPDRKIDPPVADRASHAFSPRRDAPAGALELTPNKWPTGLLWTVMLFSLPPRRPGPSSEGWSQTRVARALGDWCQRWFLPDFARNTRKIRHKPDGASLRRDAPARGAGADANCAQLKGGARQGIFGTGPVHPLPPPSDPHAPSGDRSVRMDRAYDSRGSPAPAGGSRRDGPGWSTPGPGRRPGRARRFPRRRPGDGTHRCRTAPGTAWWRT
jgi:hypothetical protein